jgi:hypothetical protein
VLALVHLILIGLHSTIEFLFQCESEYLSNLQLTTNNCHWPFCFLHSGLSRSFVLRAPLLRAAGEVWLRRTQFGSAMSAESDSVNFIQRNFSSYFCFSSSTNATSIFIALKTVYDWTAQAVIFTTTVAHSMKLCTMTLHFPGDIENIPFTRWKMVL